MKNLLLAALTCIFSLSSYSQNPVWSMSGQKVNYIAGLNPPYTPTLLPSPSAGSYPGIYDGRSPELGSNAILKEDGTLAFFIIDQHVFDEDGFLIETLWDSYGTSELRSNGEIEVIPVPNHCNKYYIISTNAGGQNVTGVGNDYDIAYNVIDLEKEGDDRIEEQYGISLTDSTFGWAKADMITVSNLHYATTPIMANGNRMLYISNNTTIFVYEVNENGIDFKQDLTFSFIPGVSVPGYPDTPQFVGTASREYGDMQVVPYGSGYRLAFTCRIGAFSQFIGLQPQYETQTLQVWVYGLDANGEVIKQIDPNTGAVISWLNGVIIFPETDPQNPPYISGIEFSKTGSHIVINQQNQINNLNIKRYAITPIINSGYNKLNLSNVNSSSLLGSGNSKINRGLDQKYYIAGSNGLSSIDYSGSTPVLTQNAVPFTNNYIDVDAAYGITGGGIRPYYMIPNQILESYSSKFSNSCCKSLNNIYREYIASESIAIWDGLGTNPFGSTEVIIYEELRFPAGTSTTIKNMTFQFMKDAKVVIEKGARVTLNGSTFTAKDCGDFLWQGIFVHGNPALAHNQPQFQGRLALYNGSEISNAFRGVSLYARDNNENILFNTSGGIITATNSTFRNNRKDVEFIPFDFDQQSSFNKCNFITDAQLSGGAVTDAHVTLFGVKNISFRGCNFDNTTGNLYSTGNKGEGIRSYNSNFYIDNSCNSLTFPCPSGNLIPTTFHNLHHAIIAEASSPINSFSIKNSLFNNCHRGVLVRGVDYFVFRNNITNVGLPLNPPLFSYGLYIQNCTGYAVEDNDFINNGTSPGHQYLNYYGIMINNSNNNGASQDVNSIYKNSFVDINKSIMSFSYNVGINGNGNYNKRSGLKLKCNSFENSGSVDIGVQGPGGISPVQGGCKTFESGANNDFSLPIGVMGDFVNGGSNVSFVDYYYNYNPFGNFEPVDYNATTTSVFGCPIYYVPIEGCKSLPYGDDLTGKDIKRKILNEKTQGKALKLTAKNANTKFQNNWVKAKNGTIGWGKFKNRVLNVSPYLKEAHLNRLINRSNIVPNGIIKQILIANSPLPSATVELLLNSSLSNGIKNNVMSFQNGEINPREELDGTMFTHFANKKLYKNTLIRNYILDTTIVDGLDSLEKLLENNSDVFYKCQLIDVKIANKKYSEAQSIVDSLRNEDNGAHTQFCKFRDLLIQMEQEVNNCYSLEANTTYSTSIDTIRGGDIDDKYCLQANMIYNKVNEIFLEEVEPDFFVVKSATFSTQETEFNLFDVLKFRT